MSKMPEKICTCGKCEQEYYLVKLQVESQEYLDFGDTVDDSEVHQEVVIEERCLSCDLPTKEVTFESVESDALLFLRQFMDGYTEDDVAYGRRVEVCEDGLYINDHEGVEIVSWTIDEIKEDPSVAFAMTNALVMFFTQGEDALKRSIVK